MMVLDFTWLEMDLLHVDSKIAWSPRILISWVHHVANRQAPYQVGMGYRQRAKKYNISKIYRFWKQIFFPSSGIEKRNNDDFSDLPHHLDHSTAPNMDGPEHLPQWYDCADWMWAFCPINRVHSGQRSGIIWSMVLLV